jgi:nucleoid-associated protein YejK
MYGLASDDQRGRDEGTGIADFFLSTFLGCQLKTNPEKATRDFVRAAEEFINDDVASNERRAEYQVALLAKMQDQTRDLRPRSFANQHLRAHDRPRFLERVAAHGLDPDVSFEKDTSLAKVSGFRLVFAHGMTLVGSREDLNERVQIPEAPGVDGVVITDTLKRLTGR